MSSSTTGQGCLRLRARRPNRAVRRKAEYHDLVNLTACLTLISGLYFAWNTVALGEALPTPQPDSLVGVWGSENVFGPSVRGELVIDARRPEWRAKIAGYDVPIRRNRVRLHFQFETTPANSAAT